MLTFFPFTLPYPYLSTKSRINEKIRGLRLPIFRNSPTVIVQLANEDPVGDFRFVTKIQHSFQNVTGIHSVVSPFFPQLPILLPKSK
jgi:hypothetical protein